MVCFLGLSLERVLKTSSCKDVRIVRDLDINLDVLVLSLLKQIRYIRKRGKQRRFMLWEKGGGELLRLLLDRSPPIMKLERKTTDMFKFVCFVKATSSPEHDIQVQDVGFRACRFGPSDRGLASAPTALTWLVRAENLHRVARTHGGGRMVRPGGVWCATARSGNGSIE